MSTLPHAAQRRLCQAQRIRLRQLAWASGAIIWLVALFVLAAPHQHAPEFAPSDVPRTGEIPLGSGSDDAAIAPHARGAAVTGRRFAGRKQSNEDAARGRAERYLSLEDLTPGHSDRVSPRDLVARLVRAEAGTESTSSGYSRPRLDAMSRAQAWGSGDGAGLSGGGAAGSGAGARTLDGSRPPDAGAAATQADRRHRSSNSADSAGSIGGHGSGDGGHGATGLGGGEGSHGDGNGESSDGYGDIFAPPDDTGGGSDDSGPSDQPPSDPPLPGVPEPASLILMGTGLVVLARALRRTKPAKTPRNRSTKVCE